MHIYIKNYDKPIMGNTSSPERTSHYDVTGTRHSTAKECSDANDKMGIGGIIRYTYDGSNSRTVLRSTGSTTTKETITTIKEDSVRATKRGRDDDDNSSSSAKMIKSNCYLDGRMYVKDTANTRKLASGAAGAMASAALQCAWPASSDKAFQKGMIDEYDSRDRDDTGHCKDDGDKCTSDKDCSSSDVCSFDRDSIPNPN